jgi:hypothetical protein
MQTKTILNASKTLSNPFDGRDAAEVWAELKAKAKPVDKAKLLAAMAEAKKNRV